MKKQDYISLIAKGLTNETNQAEAEKLTKLETTDQEFSSIYNDMQEIWEKAGSYAPTATFDPSIAYDKFAAKYQIPIDNTSSTSSKYLKIVFALALFALLSSSSLFIYNNYFSQEKRSNESSSMALMEFGDDQFTLAPGAEIYYNKEGDIVNLKGNAFFEANNKATIDLGKAFIDANNSAFNLSKVSDSDKIRIDVKEGRLLYTFEGQTKEVVEQSTLIYDLGQNSLISNQINSSTPNNYLQWNNNRLSFNRTHLAIVFEEMEQFFGIEIVVKGKIGNNCHFTAPLIQGATVKSMFELLHSSFRYKLVQSGTNTYEVSSINCKQ